MPKIKQKAIDPALLPYVQELVNNKISLETTLTDLSKNDTDVIAHAESIIKEYMKLTECISGFLTIIQESQLAQARAMAAILLKNRIGKYWSKFNADAKHNLKEIILGCLETESEKGIRRSLCTVAAVITRMHKVESPWNEMFLFINNCASSEVAWQREMAYLILIDLGEYFSGMEEDFDRLKNLYQTGLGDPEEKVVIAALEAADAFVSNLLKDQHLTQIQDLIPSIIQGAQHCLEKGEESTVSKILELFSSQCEQGNKFVNPYVEEIVELCLQVLVSEVAENSTKDIAGLLVGELAENKPAIFGKKNLCPAVIQVLMQMIATSTDNAAGALLQEWEQGEKEEDEEYDGASTQHIAQQCLDTIATSINAKYFYQPVKDYIVQGLEHEEADYRKAACALMGIIVEGMVEMINPELEQWLESLFAATKDPEVKVRECACFALGQLSEFCQDDILEYHGQILPVLFDLLKDATVTVQSTSCHVLEVFCSQMSKETMHPYLEDLMGVLCELVQSDQVFLKSLALGAISACATGAEEHFARYVHDVTPYVMNMTTYTEPRLLKLRGRALECISKIGLTVTLQEFEDYLTPTIDAAIASLTLEDTELKEDAIYFLGYIVKLTKEQIEPYLPQIMPHIIKVIREIEIIPELEEDEEQQKVNAIAGDIDEYDEEDGDQNGGGGVNGENVKGEDGEDGEDETEDYYDNPKISYMVNSGTLKEKRAAIFLIAQFSMYCGTPFSTYVEAMMEEMQVQAESLNPYVRSEVASTFPHLVRCAKEALDAQIGIQNVDGEEKTWSQGVVTPLDPTLVKLTNTAIGILCSLAEIDEETIVAEEALESLETIIDLVGPSILNESVGEVQNIDEIVKILAEGWEGKLPSQEDDMNENNEVEDEDVESNVMDRIGDLTGCLARVLGELFIPGFDQLIQFIATCSNHALEYRRRPALGTFGEVIQEVPAIGSKYMDDLFDILEAGTRDTSLACRRNAVYTLGLYAEILPKETLQTSSLALLKTYYAVLSSSTGPPKEVEALVDNTISSVMRLMMVATDNFPFDDVMEIILRNIPLKVDHQEDETVYKGLLFLVEGHTQIPSVQANIGSFLQIYGSALNDKRIKDEVKNAYIGPALSKLYADFTNEVNVAFDTFPADAQAATRVLLGL